MVGLRTGLGVAVLVVALLGVGLGVFQLNQAISQLNNCGEQCFDLERAFLGLEVQRAVPQRLTVVLLFVFHNPSPLSAYIVSLPFVVEIAGVQVGSGELCCLPFLVPANGQVEVAGIIDIPFGQIPGLVTGAIQQYRNQGTLQYRVHGTITMRAVLFGMTVPFAPNIVANFDKQGNFV